VQDYDDHFARASSGSEQARRRALRDPYPGHRHRCDPLAIRQGENYVTRWRRAAREGVPVLAVTLLLLVAAEVGLRVSGRVRTGSWPRTQISAFYDTMHVITGLYRRHPFLQATAREGTRVRVGDHEVAFNSLGYRSPERPRAKPPQTRRVVCAGGSTTVDLLAPNDQETWPWLLEVELRRTVPAVEVWNAGCIGWTSLENLISLADRDVDLAPDVVVLLQGINDLQPAVHEPFDPQYERGHAEVSLRALGLDLPPLPWWQRSLLLEQARKLAVSESDPWGLLRPPARPGPQRLKMDSEAVVTFARNVRSFIAVAREHGARVLLVTQTIRIRQQHRDSDLAYLAGWLPGLDPVAAPAQLERFNDVLRRLADGRHTVLADAASEVGWTDGDFADPMHSSSTGSAKLAAYLAGRVGPLLEVAVGGTAEASRP
jgi:lysophospholipase L1-like esterase